MGPCVVEVDGVRRAAGPPLRQAVLACLAGLAGTVVSKERLMDAVWGEELPGNASGNIHTYVAALRKQLDPGRPQRATDGPLATVTGGYCLRLPAAHLDSVRFLDLCALARNARDSDPEAAARTLREALALWRGSALQGVPGPFARAERERLSGLRLGAVEDHARLSLALGEADNVVQELSQIVRDHPLRESAHALLMAALERAGQRDEALRLYERLAARLRDELAVQPGAELARLYQRFRRGDPALAAPAAGFPVDPGARGARGARRGGASGVGVPGPGASGSDTSMSRTGADVSGSRADAPGAGAPRSDGSVVRDPHGRWGAARATAGHGEATGHHSLTAPAGAAGPTSPTRAATPATPTPRRHLPPRPGRFVGREEELAGLAAHVRAGEGARVCVVAGSAGTGKTTLALEWAHRAVAEFPDGCLHAELRGFVPGARPLEAGAALYDFLVALDVPPERIPHTSTARAALFRALTEDRRMLVVLDDVRAAEQVLPLLPAGPGCAALVTSRRRLDTLVVRGGARALHLGPMRHEEARALLDACAGTGRTGAEAAAADELVDHCARLPLALAVLGNRLAGAPRTPPRELLARLREGGSRLDVLSCARPDLGVDLRTAFRASAAALSEPGRRAFLLLGLYPGPCVDTRSAAALLDRPAREAATLLAELAANTLLTEAGSGRYRCHDLLREFAREEAETLLPDHELAEARLRLLRRTLWPSPGGALLAPRTPKDLLPVRQTPWPAGGRAAPRRGDQRWFVPDGTAWP